MISTKTCSKCKEEQPIDNFSKNHCLKDGLCNWCKECTKEYHRRYYCKNRDEFFLKHKKYNEANKDKIKEMQADWYKRNREEQQEKHRKYYRDNRDRMRAYYREYHARPEVKAHRAQYQKENKEKIKEYQRQYRGKNREHIRKSQREYYRNNPEKVRKWRENYESSHKEQRRLYRKKYNEKNRKRINSRVIERLHSDPIFRMKEQTRNMVRYALRAKGHRKTSHTADIVGCDLGFLCEHLLKTWEENYGKLWTGEPYHIDHIIPLSIAKTEEDVLRLCHYTNLQMLTPEDNLKKSNRVFPKI